MSKKIVVITGSPRKNGNNLQLLREFPGKVYRCADHLMTDVTAEYAPAITND